MDLPRDISTEIPTTTTHLATHPNANKYSANTLNKSHHSTITQKHPNLAESGGKTRRVKKVSKGDENCVEKLKKQPNLHAFYSTYLVLSDASRTHDLNVI